MAYYIELFILLTIVSYLFYKWATATFQTFSMRNVKHDRPYLLVGNVLPVFTSKESMHTLLIKQHAKFQSEKIYGFYSFRDPAFIIRDIDLIKKIAIKDFDNFPNHRTTINARDDELVGSMLTLLEDQKWKDMRATLTPVFTGSKMRNIFQLINVCSSEAVGYLRKEVKPDGSELELKDFFTRYTLDVIASAAFGYQINSFKDKDNEFYKSGRKIVSFKGLALLKLFVLSIFPKILKVFKLRVFDVKSLNYLKKLVVDSIRFREGQTNVRQDMIHLLIETQKLNTDLHGNAKWSENEVVAQCLLFFFAGFETVGNMLCFTAYELVKNPEVQEQLYQEILQMDEDLNGASLTYDSLKKMRYLEMVVSESLRKWPPAIITDRICSRSYTLNDASGKFVAEFKPGDNIWFSIIGCHYDEEIFPNPYEFDPERFNPDNDEDVKEKIKNSFIPFGVGPRNCIGNRFALMEAKAVLYYLLSEFKFEEGARTVPDLYAEMKGFQVAPKDNFWIKFVPRRV